MNIQGLLLQDFHGPDALSVSAANSVRAPKDSMHTVIEYRPKNVCIRSDGTERCLALHNPSSTTHSTRITCSSFNSERASQRNILFPETSVVSEGYTGKLLR